MIYWKLIGHPVTFVASFVNRRTVTVFIIIRISSKTFDRLRQDRLGFGYCILKHLRKLRKNFVKFSFVDRGNSFGIIQISSKTFDGFQLSSKIFENLPKLRQILVKFSGVFAPSGIRKKLITVWDKVDA